MINISALDNIIAVVVVILLLSLIVQSIQSVFKKALKIKSRQIEDSLVDLFENVLNSSAKKQSSSLIGKLGASPILRGIYKFFHGGNPHPADPRAHPDDRVKKLFNDVMKGFKDVGRVAQTGNEMMDSISKDDLKKIMGKVLPETLVTDFSTKLMKALEAVGPLITAIKTIEENMAHLSGDSKAKFAALQQALAPLLNDLSAIFDGEKISTSLIIEDVVRLREINLKEVLATLGELQGKVAEDLNKANQSNASGTKEVVAGLNLLSGSLADVSGSLTKLTNGLDAAIAPLRTKLDEVENWYDTVTHSFEERYARGMKTWAIVISFLVVAYLNASVFDIYRNVSTNDAMRNQLVQMGEERVKTNEQRLAQAREKAKEEAAKPNNEQATADAKKAEAVTLDEISEDTKKIQAQVEALSGFGFHPLTWQGVKARVKTLWTADGWANSRKEDLKTLAGWIVMTFLLSVGAPFWQDTLESLFGVKNLLRKKSDTKNTESESGAGQTQT